MLLHRVMSQIRVTLLTLTEQIPPDKLMAPIQEGVIQQTLLDKAIQQIPLEVGFEEIVFLHMVNVSKCQTLFSFGSQIICGYHGWNSHMLDRLANREDTDQTASSKRI